MKTRSYKAAGRLLLAGALAVSPLLALFAPQALAADRAVLCEEFTNEWCLACSYAGPALSQMLDIYDDTFIFVQYHADWYEPNDPDPMLVLANERMQEFYGSSETPTTVFNGHDLVTGSLLDSDQQYDFYRVSHFLPERSVTTDVTIDISATHSHGQTYDVSVTVGVEPDGAQRSMRIYIVQVLDYWPDTKPFYRNGIKQMAATEDLTLAPGQSQVVEREITLDGDSASREEDVRIIAWAQLPQDVGPAYVFQAAQRRWPLVALPDDDDADGFLDDVDNCPHRYNPDQADGDGDGVGDVCDNCDADYNPDQIDQDEDAYGDECDNCPTFHSVYLDDTDGDEVGDACDACPDYGEPGQVDQSGKVIGAIDIDCDIDAADFALFESCMAGPGITTPPPECDPVHFGRADIDNDGDVDLSDFVVFSQNCTGPLPSPALYIGVSSCIDCHTDRHAEWMLTDHANAMATLQASGDEDNILCLTCHTVGFGTASGFVDLDTTPELANVQCENCHGPGSNHVFDPNNVPLAIDYSSNLCGQCHQSCHGLCGDDHHPEYENWQESRHASALDVMWEPDFEVSCLECHSTDYRFGDVDPNNPWQANLGVECVACHTPHSIAVPSQLRLPAYELCAQCHTMRDAVPDDVPDQPQSEVLHGFGGYKLDGTALDGPYTAHWWDISDECAQCHMLYELVFNDETGQWDVDSGHRFLSNMRACEPCHTEEVATLLVSATQYEMSIRLDAIAPYFDPGDPLYVDPNLLSPEERARYDIARFNYDLVIADRSLGSHNPEYTRALLDETEEFFDIPPWDFLLPPQDGGGSSHEWPTNLSQAEMRP